MKAIKTAVLAATMMTAATGMSAEISGNVALGSEYFLEASIKPVEKRYQAVSMSILKMGFMWVHGLRVLILVTVQSLIITWDMLVT